MSASRNSKISYFSSSLSCRFPCYRLLMCSITHKGVKADRSCASERTVLVRSCFSEPLGSSSSLWTLLPLGRSSRRRGEDLQPSFTLLDQSLQSCSAYSLSSTNHRIAPSLRLAVRCSRKIPYESLYLDFPPSNFSYRSSSPQSLGYRYRLSCCFREVFPNESVYFAHSSLQGMFDGALLVRTGPV